MVAPLEFFPVVLAIVLLGLLVGAAALRPLERGFSRIAWALFSGEQIDIDPERRRSLRAAGIGTPYRLYQVKTLLYATLAALSGLVLGSYATGAIVDLLGVNQLELPIGSEIFSPLPDWLVSFDAKYAALLVLGSVLLGVSGATIVYLVRWNVPSVRADTRKRQIDAGMPRMVAFIYALSRGGMSFPEVMRTLSENQDVFGTGAEEMGIGVREIDLFGDDLITAVRTLATRTPSEQFQSFTENLTSVLQSGQDVSEFLRDEYERYRAAADEQQREILDVLATVSEVYVTVAVAGMLFLITILLIIGLTTGGMLDVLRIISYVLLPATNVLFIAYLSEVTQPLRATRSSRPEADTAASAGDVPVAPDGGMFSVRTRENVSRLRIHRRLRRLQRFAASPGRTLLDSPTRLLYVTIPVALVFIIVQFPAYITDGAFDVRVFDDVAIQAALLVLTTFAIVYEIQRRRLQRLEEAVPDLLDRLASLNEAGLSVVSSFDRVRRSEMGALDDEVDRIWRDVEWGSTVEAALERFERRVRTPSVRRVVTLLTNSMRASNEIGPVLRIAAEQARADQRLKRQRRQETMTYLIVIYISFLVFLVVIGAIDTVLVPNLPTGAGAGGGPFGGIGKIDKAAYQLVFFHAALVQAGFSGLVGGQMAGGSLKDGAKHASVMLLVAYVVFLASQALSFSGVVGDAAAVLLPL